MDNFFQSAATDPRWLSAAIVATSFVVCAILTAIQPGNWTVDTKSRITSTLHAFVSTTLSVIVLHELLVSDPGKEGYGSLLLPSGKATSLTPDLVWHHGTHMANIAVCVTLGYIMFDSVLGIAFPGLLDVPMSIHHGIVIVAYTGGIISNFGINYLALFLINEASTPFVNLFFLTKDTWKDWRKAANGLAMWFSYLTCRLLINSFYAVSMFMTLTTNAYSTHIFLTLIYLFIFCTAQLLNLNWFYRITKGLVKEVAKLFSSSSRSSKMDKLEPAVLSSPQQDPGAAQSARQRKH